MGWWEDRCKGTDIWDSHKKEYNRYRYAPKSVQRDQEALNRYYLLDLSSRWDWLPRYKWMAKKEKED